jgi:hypothetical protein
MTSYCLETLYLLSDLLGRVLLILRVIVLFITLIGRRIVHGLIGHCAVHGRVEGIIHARIHGGVVHHCCVLSTGHIPHLRKGRSQRERHQKGEEHKSRSNFAAHVLHSVDIALSFLRRI